VGITYAVIVPGANPFCSLSAPLVGGALLALAGNALLRGMFALD